MWQVGLALLAKAVLVVFTFGIKVVPVTHVCMYEHDGVMVYGCDGVMVCGCCTGSSWTLHSLHVCGCVYGQDPRSVCGAAGIVSLLSMHTYM